MTGPRILIVTPDPFVQGTIEQALGDALGLKVIKRSTFGSGDSLYSETGSAPAMLILDASSPEIDPCLVIEVIHRDGRTAGIPIMMLAPRGGNRTAFECLQRGANAVLEAPLNVDELIGTTWWLLRDQLFRYLGGRETGTGAGENRPRPTPDALPIRPVASPPSPAPSSSPPPPVYPHSALLNQATQSGDSPPSPAPPPRRPPAKSAPSGARDDSTEDQEAASTRLRLFGYELEGVIGSGGMATVYRATQTSLERPVAVKVIARDLAESAEFSARFIREARVQASLSHPNIVQVHDLGSSGPLLFIVMELVEGDSLRHWIEQGRLTPPHWMHVARVLGDTVNYLHGRDVYHRDVKPANLLVGNDGVLKLSDFGITYRPDPRDKARLTSGNFSLGTPFFMPPEQRIDPTAVSNKVDVFSVAVFLHVMVAGGITSHPLPELRAFHPKMPHAVHASLEPGLQCDPEKRPGDVREITEPFILAVRDYWTAATGLQWTKTDGEPVSNPFALRSATPPPTPTTPPTTPPTPTTPSPTTPPPERQDSP